MEYANSLLAGRYRVVKAIGKGNQGTVYEARDEQLNRIVALKEAPIGPENPREALMREAQLLAGLGKHPALPMVFEYFSLADSQFLVMEYVPGENLAQLLKDRGAPFPFNQVLHWAERLLSALEYMHTSTPPIIHRDVKPQNIKLNNHGDAMLLDFGLAKDQKVGSLIYGYTPAYAPPEQLRGLPTDARSDLYALGATLYQLSTNVLPTDALTRQSALEKHLRDPLIPARDLNSSIPPGISAALTKAMSLDLSFRPQSAAEFRESLRLSPATSKPTDASEQSTLRMEETQSRRMASDRPIKYELLGRAEGHILSVAFSPNGEFIAAGSWDKLIRIWRVATGEMRVVGQCDSPVASVSFSPDGSLLASASSDVRLWKVESGQLLRKFNQFSFCVAFSPDGRWLAWSSKAPSANEGAVCVWNMAEAQPRILGTLDRWVRSIAFSPDSRSLVSGSRDKLKSICLWDIATQQYKQLGCCPHGADSVAFSRDGSHVASAGKLITLLSLHNSQISTMGTPADCISSIAFSPDDKYIVSGGMNVCMWEVRSGQMRTVKEGNEHINSVAFSPDGSSIAAGGNDMTVQLWPAWA
jgi:serine/threonine protein kinase